MTRPTARGRLVRAGLISSLLLSSGACSSDPETDASTPDSGTPDGAPRSDAAPPVDGAADAGNGADGSQPDALAGDAFAPDTGVLLAPELSPGAYAQVAEGRIEVMSDTFSSVRSKLGSGTRSAAANTRSYEWSLSSGVELTIWFANTIFDDDDAPPADVDDGDRVLWIAVQGGFAGRTPNGVGLGSSRASVEAGAPGGYGAPPHTVALTDPPGELAQYFEAGFLVAYDPSNNVRTITICRAYPRAPAAPIDVPMGELDFTGGSIRGSTSLLPPTGSSASEVSNLLGAPDAEGDVVISGVEMHLLSYGFIGIEVFVSRMLNVVLFMSVHAPYYGTIAGSGAGVGATRPEIESALGLGPGAASPSSASFICYPDASTRQVGVSYSQAPDVRATTITVPLLACP